MNQLDILLTRAEITLNNLQAAQITFPTQVHDTRRDMSNINYCLQKIEAGIDCQVSLRVNIERADKRLLKLAQAVNPKHLDQFFFLARLMPHKLDECMDDPTIKCKDCWDTGYCQKCLGDNPQCPECKGSGKCHCQKEVLDEV
jgi:hypothetical protein